MERYTRSYLRLIKPGITLSNTLTAIAGYFLAASRFGFNWSSLVGVTGGVALVIASACVINNMTDHGLDARMKRTKTRDLAAGKISMFAAGIYAFLLGVGGFYLLMALTNGRTAALGALAYIWYVLIYAIAKRTTPLSTIIGAVCGALPPVAGYVAVSDDFDIIAWTLFGMLMVWQLPHFYAIAVFRRDEYQKAGLPVWSVRYGNASTNAQIFFWTVVFVLIVPLLTLFKSAGYVYLVVMLVISLYWVYVGATTYRKLDPEKWSRRMFGISLLTLLVTSGAVGIGGYLP